MLNALIVQMRLLLQNIYIYILKKPQNSDGESQYEFHEIVDILEVSFGFPLFLMKI